MIYFRDKKNVVLLEDDDEDARLIERSLRKSSFRISRFTSLEALSRFLSDTNDTIDVILSDLNIEDSRELDTFFYIKKHYPHIPVIVLSGYDQDDLPLKAVCEGAQDFIRKSEVNSSRLSLQINFAIERARLISELKFAKEESEKQSGFKSEFLAHFSHEIRTPLNAVIGAVSLLEDLKSGEEADRLLDSLRSGSERMLSIVNDILDLSKIESGKMSVNPVMTNIRDLVGDVLTTFAIEARRKGIFLADFIDPDVPSEVETDPDRVKQILLNLISNALKFTDDGQIIVAVSMRGEKHLMFSVQDSGRGISSHQENLIFEPFSQCSKKDVVHGTGLGLSLCKQICDLLGGEIGVCTDQPKGCTFWFSVMIQKMTWSRNPRTEFKNMKKKLLLFSSERINSEVIQRQLESREIATQIITKINDLLNQIRSNSFSDKFSLLIFDDQHISGDDIMKVKESFAIRGLSDFPVIIFSSANAWQGSSQGHIPVHHPSLLALVEKCLKSSSPPEDHTGNVIDLSSFREKKFLVVDDDPVNRSILSKMLSHIGAKSEVASNGMEAIEKIKGSDEAFEAVFMDFSMPDMGGLEVAKNLRALGNHVVIVGYSANAFDKDRVDCLKSGMDLFLAKPARLEHVQNILLNIKKLNAG